MTTALDHAFNRFGVCLRCYRTRRAVQQSNAPCVDPPRTETTGVIENLFPPDRDPGDER